MDSNVISAFLLTLFAGLSTGIGSIIGIFVKRTNKLFLSTSLGFSAGVMIFVSFIEIYPKARDIIDSATNGDADLITMISFFVGMILIFLIDKLIPQDKNVEEIEESINCDIDEDNNLDKVDIKTDRLLKMGIFTALAVSIHNFPEGLATFMSALADPSLGVPIAIAIAIHNIPEGLAVSVPIFYATNNKLKAFTYSFFSGLTEPIGAFIGYMILRPFLNDLVIGTVFAGVAGIMIFISLSELLPTAKDYGKNSSEVYGLILGMIVMGVSLILL